MSTLQHDKIEALCGELRLADVAQSYPTLAQQAADKDWSHSDFLEAANDSKELHVDLSQVEDIDTSGVQNLLALMRWAEKEEKQLSLNSPSQTVLEVLTLLNITERLGLDSQQQEANG